MSENFNTENIQFEKINQNRNEYFKHDYKNMFNSKIQQKITINSLFV